MLSAVQRLLLAALGQRDPAAWLQAQLASAPPELSPEEVALLRAAGADGLRLTRLLVQKLRLERLLRGDPAAAGAFATGPEEFLAVFRRYCERVPPTAVFPSEEARAFAAYRRSSDGRAGDD